MLAIGKTVGYLQEPFNPINNRPGHFAHGFAPGVYAQIDPQKESRFVQAFSRILEFRYVEAARWPIAKNGRDIGRRCKHSARLALFRMQGRRALVKDPFALFAAPWIHSRFGSEVVVTIRHPVAFAGSLCRIGESFPFECLASQSSLLNGVLRPYARAVKRAESKPLDMVSQAILLWNIFADVIASYRRDYPGWIFVRHEDLSSDPVDRFRELYERLDLPFTAGVGRRIQALTSDKNPVTAQKAYGTSPLNSRLNAGSWRRRVPLSQQQRVLEGVRELARGFYSDEELRPGAETP